MKINQIVIVILILFGYNEKLVSQCDVESILTKLNSSNSVEIFEALDSIIICDITEAIPTLETKFYSEQGITLKYYFLDALHKLSASNIQILANSFVNEVDDLSAPEGIKVSNKLSAIQILFELGDYSTAQLVFEITDNNTLSLNSLLIDLLEEIIQNIPSLEEGAKSRLISQSLNARYGWDRFKALNILVDNYELEMLDLVLGIAENDPDMSVRMQALSHLISFNYEDLKQFLNQRINIEEDPSIRVNIADAILMVFGEPSDLKSILDYLPNETDTVAYSVIENYTQLFIPPKPGTLNWNELTTKLIDYTNEMYGYGWIANEETRDHYLRYLTAIIESITETGSTVAACSMIQSEILERLEEDLSMELVTVEGYKFLHYDTVYIKEEIEENYGACLY